jgi:UDP-GlcNAc:undecaprenyl-phosphate GlcNAc-1-phosphate transferase
VVIGLVAAVVTCAATPLVGIFARRMGWVYLPNDRTVHETPLPDIGGLAMYIGFVAAYVTASLTGALDVVFRSNSEPRGVFVAVTIIYAVGLLDDVREISAPAKVFGIVLAGIALVQFGVVMFAFRLPFYDGSIFLDESLRPLITILWLLGMSTVVNLVDGLDGLAAGIVGIGSISFFLYSERLTDLDLLDSANVGPLFAVIAAGLCIGFLPHNFNPARSFDERGWRPCRLGRTRVGRNDLFLPRTAGHPAPYFGRADLRHAVRHRPASDKREGAHLC